MSTGTLYVVATPLGNLGDLSARAIETLCRVDVVAAEDTRRSRQLLNAIGASPRLISWHAHSGERRTQSLIEILRDGHDMALVTDAGTPAISDPGVELVQLAHQAAIPVVPIPGPSAVPTALSASGISGDRYLFLGFLPRKGRERKELLNHAVSSPWSVVFFESPLRIVELLAELQEMAGETRPAAVARELTKLHEEIRCGTLAELLEHYRKVPPRGEITLILSPGKPADPVEVDFEQVVGLIRTRLEAGESPRDLARQVAEQFGLSRNEAYRLVMEWRQ